MLVDNLMSLISSTPHIGPEMNIEPILSGFLVVFDLGMRLKNSQDWMGPQRLTLPSPQSVSEFREFSHNSFSVMSFGDFPATCLVPGGYDG